VIAKLQFVGDHEAFTGHHFIAAAALDPSSAPQKQIVHERPSMRRHRHQSAARRFIETFQIEGHVRRHASLDRRDIWNGPNFVGHAQRRALQ
jgi:hypothetical protein